MPNPTNRNGTMTKVVGEQDLQRPRAASQGENERQPYNPFKDFRRAREILQDHTYHVVEYRDYRLEEINGVWWAQGRGNLISAPGTIHRMRALIDVDIDGDEDTQEPDDDEPLWDLPPTSPQHPSAPILPDDQMTDRMKAFEYHREEAANELDMEEEDD